MADLVVGGLFSQSIFDPSAHIQRKGVNVCTYISIKNPEVRNQNPYREKKRIISEKNASERDLSSEI